MNNNDNDTHHATESARGAGNLFGTGASFGAIVTGLALPTGLFEGIEGNGNDGGDVSGNVSGGGCRCGYSFVT